ncbi:MAG: hypothetical protein EDM74_12355, partial [Armatimonadetes bacterium]
SPCEDSTSKALAVARRPFAELTAIALAGRPIPLASAAFEASGRLESPATTPVWSSVRRESLGLAMTPFEFGVRRGIPS